MYSAVDPERTERLIRTLRTTEHIPGDVAECGVYLGGSAWQIAKATKKPVHLFDTFCGIPENDSIEGGHSKGDFACPLETVKENLSDCPNCVYHPGEFLDTLPLWDTPLSLIHCDADTFQGTTDVIMLLWPWVSDGGAIVFDDYNWPHCPGVKMAVDCWLDGERIEKYRQQAIIWKKPN